MSNGQPRKILALSLLRLGDVALCAPALRAVRDAHPHAQITLVLNRSSLGITPLLPYVDRFVVFDRDELQRGLSEAHRPLFEPYETLKLFVDRLAAERFDLTLNYTHTKLSGCIAGLAGAARTIGLSIDEAGRVALGSRWFGLLDEQAGRFDVDAFHYSDIFRFVVGGERCLPYSSYLPSLQESVRGAQEACAVFDSFKTREVLAVQAFTSDAKKNWDLDRFVDAISHVVRSRSGQTLSGSSPLAVALLGAEFERARLEPLERALQAAGVDARMAITSVEGLYSVIARSALTLTGDTVAMHFAAAAGTPCVALAIGSSDWKRTGPYADECFIVQARELCAPCAHSRGCPLPHRTCADRITSESVAAVVSAALNRDTRAMRRAAREHAGDVDVLRTHLGPVWSACEVGVEPRAELVLLIARAAWKMRIDGADGKELIADGYSAVAKHLATIACARSLTEDWEKAFLERESHLRSLLELARSASLHKNSLSFLRKALALDPAALALARAADASLQNLETATEFTAARLIQSVLKEIIARLAIEARIARAAAAESKLGKSKVLNRTNLFIEGAGL